MVHSIESRAFGFLPPGEAVGVWTLIGRRQMILEAPRYSGIARRLYVPDHDGCLADVLREPKNLHSYIANRASWGALMRRVAGRISDACFGLARNPYTLSSNNRPNHLNGGAQGFDKSLWAARPLESPSVTLSLRLTYISPDSEDGHPNTVNVDATHTLTDFNAFLLESPPTRITSHHIVPNATLASILQVTAEGIHLSISTTEQ